MTRRNLHGCSVLLTGASSGIGYALARELAARGCKLLLTARRESKLLELKTILSKDVTCEMLAGDITNPETRAQLKHWVNEHWNGLDCLINCAGVGAMGAFVDAGEARLRQVFEVNFFAAAELIREMYPALLRGVRPVIVNVSSVLGHRAVPLKSEYCASKFALHGFSDALRAELKPDGIDVLLVSPSTTDSDFFDSAIEDSAPRDWKGKRAMSPERVAKIIARSMRMGKREVILTAGGKALVWFDRLAPGVADYLITKFSK